MRCVGILVALLFAFGCDGGSSTPTDASTDPSDAADDGIRYGRWERIEIPGTVCGNGSQYKFFVQRIREATDTAFIFEPGGACWDFDSCSGRTGIRGAANPDGIEDDHIALASLGSPLLLTSPRTNPLALWNKVYLPYCTGDIHSGHKTETYVDPRGEEPDLVWHHRGHDNVQAVIGWAQENLLPVDRMFVGGCSAGGTGSIANYYFLRNGLSPARGYMLNDSGPIFVDSSNSTPMHETIRDVWALDELLTREIPEHADAILEDLGHINGVVAEEFPNDRLATTFFRLDYNYSLYSYERFYEELGSTDPFDREAIYRLWWEDTELFMAELDRYDNLAYYIPFWRELNDSHCTTLLGWDGTEIEEDGLDLRDYVEHLLDDDAPLRSYFEDAREGPHADLASGP
jgi:hypothetical protein